MSGDSDVELGRNRDENPLEYRQPEAKIISEKDEFTDALCKMLDERKEDEFIDFIENLREQESRPNVNCGQGDYTYLQTACKYGMEKVAKYLIDSGTDLNARRNEEDSVPVVIAAGRAHIGIVEHIIQRDRSQLFAKDRRNNILHLAASEVYQSVSDKDECFLWILSELVKLLPRDVLCTMLNERDDDEMTVLHIAGLSGNQKIVFELLNAGADFTKKDIFGKCAFEYIEPKTFEEFLNRNIMVYSYIKYAVKFNYKFLDSPERKTGNNVYIETGSIVCLSQSPDHRHLLKHPVISSFLGLKWQNTKWLYFLNLLTYGIFGFLFTLYILEHNGDKVFFSEFVENTIMIGIVMCLGVMMFREYVQMSISPQDYYRTLDNWVDILLIIGTIYAMCDNGPVVSAAAMFLTWLGLALIIGQHPYFSTKIEMYKTVSWSFFNFLSYYSIIIIAFALSLYVLSREENIESNPFTEIFHNVSMSIFETVVRLGEPDPKSVPFDRHPVAGRIFLLMFLLLVCIVLLNLLNGLAVSDTQTIRDEAEILALVSRLNFINSIEKSAQVTSACNVLLGNKRIKGFWVLPDLEEDGCKWVTAKLVGPAIFKAAKKIFRSSYIEDTDFKLTNIIHDAEKFQRKTDKNMLEIQNMLQQLLNFNKSVGPH